MDIRFGNRCGSKSKFGIIKLANAMEMRFMNGFAMVSAVGKSKALLVLVLSIQTRAFHVCLCDADVEVSRRCTVILELVAIVSLHKLIKYSLFFSASRVLCTAFLF
jgi:hypothetical protein